MLHHLSFGVADLARSAAFYDAALGALGYRRVWADEVSVGYGAADGEEAFAIKQRAGATAPGEGFHLALSAAAREAVDAFHCAALAQGGRDNGAPGLRPDYGPAYYAAFVTDPDGYQVEAVIVGE
ncbi:VOC family protein [Lysobacter sp. CA199]|uniref:VOC family protein n=1 Tax=Lysobacter sp. CA199 TaxID=3455608 RepID=UPI003F8D5E00